MPVAQPPPELKTGTSLFSPQFVLLLAVTTLFGLSLSTYFLLPKFLSVELAADPVTIGSVTAIFWLASVLAVPFAGGQIDRRGRKGFAAAGGLIFAISCAGFLWVDSVGPLIWALRVLQGIGFTLFYVAVSTLAADLSPPARLGHALGIFGAVMIFTNAVGPPLRSGHRSISAGRWYSLRQSSAPCSPRYFLASSSSSGKPRWADITRVCCRYCDGKA